MSESLTVLKAAMDMYQAQYTATDKLWGYFGTVSLALVAYTISSEKVTRLFPEAIAAIGAYLAFCLGNFSALMTSQRQLLELAKLVRIQGKAAGVKVDSFQPFSADEIAWFYGLVVMAITAATLLLAWHRGRRAAPKIEP